MGATPLATTSRNSNLRVPVGCTRTCTVRVCIRSPLTRHIPQSTMRENDAPVATLSPPLTFVAIALSNFGGIGLRFHTTVVRQYFDVTVLRVGLAGN